MKEIIRYRQIEDVFHFTQARNLKNIFEYGICPRTVLEGKDIQFEYNDEWRHDGCKDAVCASISFPNYKMFYKLRMDYPSLDWAILKLDAKVLIEKTCAFCWKNAGDSEMYNKTKAARMGVEPFRALFESKSGYPNRDCLDIPDCYPTNPQAEVLIFDIIEPSYIKEVHFYSYDIMCKYAELIPMGTVRCAKIDFFYPRMDYKCW